MAVAAILKNRKIAISPPRFDQFGQNLAWWLSLTLFTVPVVKISKFLESNMAVAAILKLQKSPYLSNDLTDRYKTWYGDACWPSWPCWPSKLWNCENPGARFTHDLRTKLPHILRKYLMTNSKNTYNNLTTYLKTKSYDHVLVYLRHWWYWKQIN